MAITDGNCTDTSACYNLTGIGIREITTDEIFVVYPNPNSGTFTIEFKKVQDYVQVRMLTSAGKQILLDRRLNTERLDYSFDLAAGKYFILLDTPKGKLIKEILIQ